MDDLKLYFKKEKGLESLVQPVRIFSDDIGMEFGIDKCATLVLLQNYKAWWNSIAWWKSDKRITWRSKL